MVFIELTQGKSGSLGTSQLVDIWPEPLGDHGMCQEGNTFLLCGRY